MCGFHSALICVIQAEESNSEAYLFSQLQTSQKLSTMRETTEIYWELNAFSAEMLRFLNTLIIDHER